MQQKQTVPKLFVRLKTMTGLQLIQKKHGTKNSGHKTCKGQAISKHKRLSKSEAIFTPGINMHPTVGDQVTSGQL